MSDRTQSTPSDQHQPRRGFGSSRTANPSASAPGAGPRSGPRRPPRQQAESKEWIPVTKLGRLVKDGKVKTIEEIFKFSLPVKEIGIIDCLFPAGTIKEEVMTVMPVQKQTKAGQRTRFKAFVAVGDENGHVGLGVKVAKEVATAIKGAMVNAKLSIVPVRRGYWGTHQVGDSHTVPVKVTGKCGSSLVRLIPAPRGTGIVAAPACKKILQLAGIQDCYSQTRGKTRTLGNFVQAAFEALRGTYTFLTPAHWAPTRLEKTPFQEYSDYLMKVDVRRH